ncbi:LamG-like jellyroll fold domain-containing protein [Flavobacterium sp.]|uniref:LamG-like jellyroll fold domain-containing protein n=1 Tax=Flavobacterium sp. TaxID=239 RepID=UPI0028BDC4FB|nr:LamG-like jellyroll fold domain-containing protein [Flavobacterium sp.]
MERKTTLVIRNFIVILFLNLLSCFQANSQTLITYQGFDSKPEDVWGYTNTLNTGSIVTNNSVSVSTPNSLRFGGSNNSGSGASNNDPYTTFNNVNISGYTNVVLNLSISSNGTPDDSDDLYLDISYNNGVSYPTSIKLIDGKNNTAPDNLAYTHPASPGNTVGSPYSFNIPNGNTQVRVRVRFDELDNQSNTSDNYFIDNISLYGAPLGNHITITGANNNPVPHNSLATTTNGTDFGTTQIITDPVIRTFTIRNIGSNVINLTGAPLVNISGSADFVVITNPTTPIASLNTTTFDIRFIPSSIGIKTATVSIASNDSDENPYIFQIRGEGIQTFYDSDGDGILDNVDIDDDNDGIKDDVEENNCSAANGPKVNYKFLNETFGTGGRTTINTTYNAITTYCYEDGSGGVDTPECPNLSTTDLNDGKYTVGSSAQIASWAASYWYTGPDHTTGDNNGRMALFNASYDPGIFYTATISGALPNIPITYSFWVINLDRSNAPGIATRLRPDVRVEFRDMSDNLLTAINTGDITPTNAGNPNGDWYNFTANLNLNVTAFKVIFINNETGGTGNDLALDDIVISQTLCDLDSDGVADVFDLDADNDGIEDIIEVGLGNLSNGKGRMDVAWADGNANGLHDSAEALIPVDSDGDGAPNYMDLDSDNDTLFDVDESWAGNIHAPAGYENGDGDITGDGVGDGPESETFRNKDTNGDGTTEGFGDGILDIYDYGINSYGNLDQGTNVAPFLNYVLDSDGDNIPNYLDVMSNGTNYDISLGLYASLDTNNNGIIDGNADADHDGILDAFDTNITRFGSPRNLERKLYIEFDGRNDYAADISVIGTWPNASIMAWVNLNSTFNAEGMVFGQHNLRVGVDAQKRFMVVHNGTVTKYNTPLNTSQWIHLAAIYDSANGLIKQYINGALVNSVAVSGSLSATTTLLTIGKNSVTNDRYFKGRIDEARLFNIALTDAQLQKMVYQEIRNFGGQVRGEIIPKDVPSLPWANLIRYYRLDNYKDDVIDNHSTAAIDVTPGARIYNVKTIKVQEAPMPFLTEQIGNFATASNSVSKQIRGLDVDDYDWSIIHVRHNITANANNIDLGMLVDPGVTITMNNDTKLHNDWYLKLDGKIDLVGRSQLLQTTDSDLDVTSTGTLERDQQGTGNLYNYNYWSSPVSTVASITNNNTGFTIANVLRDGTNPASPQPITWIGGYDGAANPMRLARFWLYKFTNLSDSYANWQQINENSTLQTAQAYTMKGSGIATPPAVNTQNYVFAGKPNNGLINHAGIQVGPNNQNLIGNPYPSAIDANSFITDNLTGTTGTLYFWEHYPSNSSHNLAEYQGGYAARNLVGGTIPVSPAEVSGLGSSSRIPGRYIPVGQGFFIKGNATGGQVTYQNSQRRFIKENNVDSNVMFRSNSNANNSANESNNDDTSESDLFKKIRLGYNTASGLHRQLLIGFMNEYADDSYNLGYDGEILDVQNNDAYFQLADKKLQIQGVGHFNVMAIYPITVKANVTGKVEFLIDGLENFDGTQQIFIYDNLNNRYHNIRNGKYKAKITAGETTNRFSLRFTNHYAQANDTDAKVEETTNAFYNSENQTVTVSNLDNATKIIEVTLFTVQGQKVKTITNYSDNNVIIEKGNLASGVYIVQIKTSDSKIQSNKILIQ